MKISTTLEYGETLFLYIFLYIFSLYMVIFLTNQRTYLTIKNKLTVRIVARIEAAILYLCIIKNMSNIMLYKKERKYYG